MLVSRRLGEHSQPILHEVMAQQTPGPHTWSNFGPQVLSIWPFEGFPHTIPLSMHRWSVPALSAAVYMQFRAETGEFLQYLDGSEALSFLHIPGPLLSLLLVEVKREILSAMACERYLPILPAAIFFFSTRVHICVLIRSVRR
jgi:hypothetical protein